MKVVNNRETHEDESVFYVDQNGQIFEAVIKSIVEQDGNHFAELAFTKDGKKKRAKQVPHNTSPEKHSWNHPLSEKERETHYHPDFYGKLPREIPQSESTPEERDYSGLEYDEEEGED